MKTHNLHKWRLPNQKIILASTSETRQKMLADAGLDFEAIAAPIDEEAIRKSAEAELMPPLDVAILLAELKAQRLAIQGINDTIIGCDQLLECEGILYGKPKTKASAATQLSQLAGKQHRLITAAVIFQNGQRVWHAHAAPRLAIRTMTENEIDAYLDRIGDAAFFSPGSYQIEGLGAQILSMCDGDPYAILGMPLLEILGFLRNHGLKLQTDIVRDDV